VRVHVAFTPAEALEAEIAVVVDVMRATSVIAQALASGYRRVLCCAEIDEARATRDSLPEAAVLAGERNANVIEGFDLGASPSEFVEPRAETVVMTTTNGTRAIVTAAAHCGTVLVGSLLNLNAAAGAAGAGGEDVTIVCAGYQGRFAIDDAYCAGRIVELLPGDRTDAAVASAVIAARFPHALEGLNARTYGPPGLERDLAWCAQVDTLEVVPRFMRMVGTAAEIVAGTTSESAAS
jgi:2-phosphosulfolactate phosphatase